MKYQALTNQFLSDARTRTHVLNYLFVKVSFSILKYFYVRVEQKLLIASLVNVTQSDDFSIKTIAKPFAHEN